MAKRQGNTCFHVTPHVGVWIETGKPKVCGISFLVTPHVGVWIETPLKVAKGERFQVTPHVGVWIETQQGHYQAVILSSPLT